MIIFIVKAFIRDHIVYLCAANGQKNPESRCKSPNRNASGA